MAQGLHNYSRIIFLDKFLEEKEMKFTKLKTALASSVLLASSAALAAPIPVFDYEASLVFDNLNTNFTENPVPVIVQNDPGKLSWGTDIGNGLSSLTISDTVNNGSLSILTPDTVVEDGVTVDGVGIGNTLTHQNFPIRNANFFSGTLVDNLTLSVGDEILDSDNYWEWSAKELRLDFYFFETVNQPSVNSCQAKQLDASVDYSAFTSSQLCPDLWAIKPSSLAELAPQVFEYDETLYHLQVVLFDGNGDPINLLDPAQQLYNGECELMGLDDGCIGFRTGENLLTPRTFGFAISEVPVPAAVWLFGTALLGFVGYNRRKNKA